MSRYRKDRGWVEFNIGGHVDRNQGYGYNNLLFRLIPGYLLSACPCEKFHILPGLLNSWAALANPTLMHCDVCTIFMTVFGMVRSITYHSICLCVFYDPSKAGSFRDGTNIYCPLRRTRNSVNTQFPPEIEPRVVAWQSITLPLRNASSTHINQSRTIRITSWTIALSLGLLGNGVNRSCR